MYSESCPRSKTTMLCPAARNKAELNSPQLAACKILAPKTGVGRDEQSAERRLRGDAVDAPGSIYEGLPNHDSPDAPKTRRAAFTQRMRP